MTNSQIAAALAELGTLLELQGENPFRTQAYHTAARAIDNTSDDLATAVLAGNLGAIHGIGPAIRDKIDVLVRTGAIPQLEELRASIPTGVIQMLRVPGLGPKKVRALADAGIADLAALQSACESGEVARLKGFGGKTQEKIITGLTFLDKAGGRIRLDAADRVAQPFVEFLRGLNGVHLAEICGDLRRRVETIERLTFLICADDPGPIMEAFANMSGIGQVIARGPTLTSVSIPVRTGASAMNIQAELRAVSPKQFPFAVRHFTGSDGHNQSLQQLAQNSGFKLTEFNLTGPTGEVACGSEQEVFQALGLTYIPPELREDGGELAAAAQGTIPNLVEVSDIRGVFHNHTTASDGGSTLEEMAAAAQALGFEYLGIADHSQSLAMARGLTPERVHEQHRQIDALNPTLGGFRLFKGTECDIMPDGTLDFDDATLDKFDYVVASVHTNFQQSREEVTRRIIRAVRHPKVTMLGHATGRLLLQREGYPVDLDAVLAAAAEAGTMIEINAQPKRLDIDFVHARKAKQLGIPIVINPDAHETSELAYFRYGVDVARRAWLTKDDVVNTRSVNEVEKLMRRK